jgi:hypothetical protein
MLQEIVEVLILRPVKAGAAAAGFMGKDADQPD